LVEKHVVYLRYGGGDFGKNKEEVLPVGVFGRKMKRNRYST
jgi:hypothetical protein